MGKQFKISGLNGLYLSYKPSVTVDSSNYISQLLRDNDFFPKTPREASLYSFKNAKYVNSGIIKGSNSLAQANSDLTHTEISAPNSLILNKTYYNKFTFHFNFKGSHLLGYTPNSAVISGADFGNHLNKLRVKLYVQLGSNTVPLKLTNFCAVDPTLDPMPLPFRAVTGSTAYNTTTKTGFRLNTGVGGEDCIDLGWVAPGTTIGDRMNAVNADGYTFKVDAEIPDFVTVAKGNKDYKIIVKYFNIAITGIPGVTTTAYPYNTSEAIEMMATNYVWYQLITPLTSPIEGGFSSV